MCKSQNVTTDHTIRVRFAIRKYALSTEIKTDIVYKLTSVTA